MAVETSPVTPRRRPAPPAERVEPVDDGRPAGTPAVSSRRADVANLLFGRVLRSDADIHERVSKPQGLAVFSSDALSSVAYATQEMLLVLVPVVGAAAYGALTPLSAGIVAVLALVAASYRQTIKAYPNAGGSYVVTRDNFGFLPAQLAGIALLVDYVLNVAVSVSAGVAAAYSAVPVLFGLRTPLAVGVIWFVAAVNLRGIRASGRVFTIPVYLFVVSVLAVVVLGLGHELAGGLYPVGASPGAPVAGPLTVALLLHAFASGSTAMTGVEAVSNGVSAFRPVEWRNARTVLVWLAVLLATMFVGVSWLASQVRPSVSGSETVLSQLAHAAFGHGPVADVGYGLVQAGTAAILMLSANTSFADFPRVASFQAHDHFLPEALRYRGRRLAFSNGILILAGLASALVVATGASVTRLIPLFAIGVFTAFTCSQAGMFRRHLRLREPGWRRGLVINGLGMVATAAVLVVFAVTKFAQGAWVVLVVIPTGVGALAAANRHYRRVEAELDAGAHHPPPGSPTRTATVDTGRLGGIDGILARGAASVTVVTDVAENEHRGRHQVVVLLGDLVGPAGTSLAVARRLQADRVSALHVVEHLDDDPAAVADAWQKVAPDVPLTVAAAPWREVVTPTLEHARALLAEGTGRLTVVMGWVVPTRWWLRRLHNRRARPLVAALAREPGVTAVVVAHRLRR
jgi:amino acid transporter